MKRLSAVATAATLVALAGPLVFGQPRLPAPESAFGFPACSDYKLATYEQIAEYLRKLDASSERMQLIEIGKTAEGRPQLMAIISSEENLRNLARYKEIAATLARAKVSDERARQLASEGKAVVWIDFGLHSTEVAHGQTAPLMAYRSVSEESAEMRFIRDNVIFLLVPNMNPDGTTLVATWYMKHVGTPFERSSPPVLYHKYIGHDNNRDSLMYNMPESRNVARQLFSEWFPQLFYDHHQTAPFPARIFVPPYEDPMNPNIPPLVMRGSNTVGDAISRRLEQEGKRGAISRLQFDTWWNGGMRQSGYYHNIVAVMTETAHASASPATYDVKTFPKTFANGVSTTEPSSYYPSPYLGGEWHLRDSCEYMVTASMAVLDIGAKRRQEWLYDIYQMGRDAIRAGANETFLISATQWDHGTTVKLVNALRVAGIEVERTTATLAAGGKSYPAGSFVIRGAQAFRPYLLDVLLPQVYPDQRLYPGGPPEPPYDITGWTLPYQMGVQVDHLAEAVRGPTEPVAWATPGSGAVDGPPNGAYVFDPRANDSFIAVNRLLKAGEAVHRATRPTTVGGETWPPGAFVVPIARATASRVAEAAKTLGLHVSTLARTPAATLRMKMPKVGLYRAWGGNMDEGWTRWLLEQFEFPYTNLYDKDIRARDLRTEYDVILLPDATYSSMLNGLAPGATPPEYTGGMTPRGVAALYEFVAAGGTLVAMDRASELPVTTFGLPIRNVTADLRESEFYIPGTLLRLNIDPTHPVGFGMPAETSAFFVRSPAFALGRPAGRSDGIVRAPAAPEGVAVVAQYPAKNLLKSGWLLGESVIAGRAAVVEAKIEKGRVVLLGFRTQHRGQSHGTLKLLFNAIYLGASEAAPLVTSTAGASAH